MTIRFAASRSALPPRYQNRPTRLGGRLRFESYDAELMGFSTRQSASQLFALQLSADYCAPVGSSLLRMYGNPVCGWIPFMYGV